MDQATFLWTLAATFLSGIHLFSQKVVAQEKRDSALNGVFGYSITAVLALGFLYIIYGALPDSWQIIAMIGLLSGLIHGVGSYIRIESLKQIDAVIYFPINKVLGPIIVVIGGLWFFADALTAREYVGIALSLTVPLLLLTAAEKHRQNNLTAGITLLLISTVLTAISMLVMKAGVERDATILFIMAISQIAGMVSSLVIYYSQKGARLANNIVLSRRDVSLGAVNGILQFASYYALLQAMSMGYISLVYVIHAHYILIPIILSVWWYKDHINIRKFAAIVVSCLAISLLYGA